MYRRLISVLACAMCCVAVNSASAGPIPLSYSSPSNEILRPDGTTGGLSFPNTPTTPLAGDGTIVATKLVSWSIASPSTPDTVSNLPYQFALSLRDDATGDSVRLSFEGTLTGSFWRTGASLTNRFTAPTSQTVRLAGSPLTVALTGFESPTGYGEEFAGFITAQVSLGADDPVPGPQGPEPPSTPTPTPEPAATALVVAGLLALASRWGIGRLRHPARGVA